MPKAGLCVASWLLPKWHTFKTQQEAWNAQWAAHSRCACVAAISTVMSMVVLFWQVSVRQSFARKLAGRRRAAALPLRNGRCNGAAARKRAAQEGSGAAAEDGAASGAAARATLVSLGSGLLGAVTWGEARAAQGTARPDGTALLLEPADSGRPGQPQPAAAEADEEGWAVQQHGGGAAGAAGEGQHGLRSDEDSRRVVTGGRGARLAEGSNGQALQRTVRVTVFEQAYGCVCAVEETAWDGGKDGDQLPGSSLPGFQVPYPRALPELAQPGLGDVIL